MGRALERPGPPPGETTPASSEREALLQLGTALAANVEVLRQIDVSAREYKDAAAAARAKLTEYLFWIPASRSIEAWAELVPAWQWTVSADNWRSAGSVATKEFGRAPFWPLVALVLAGALLLGRGRIRRAMDVVSPVRLGGQRYRMAHAFAALGLTLLLAVPLPILLRTLAHLLGSAPPAQPFALALSDALYSVSFLSMGLLVCVNLLGPNGLLIAHFGQEGLQLQAVARELRRFSVLFVLVIFLAALNMSNHSPFSNHESLGRSLFSLALMISSVFSWRTFRRASPFMQGLVARAPRSWAVRLHPLWAGLLVLAPVAVAGLAASGYFVAAVYFWICTLDSLFLALGAALLYALARLWVGLQRQQLSRARDAEVALQAGRGATDEPADTLAARARPPLPDVAAIGEQARSLLNLLVSLLFLAGLAFVWRDAMPALSVIGDFTLWRTHSVVDGAQVVHALTVGRLGGAILIGVVTGLAVNRVAGLLDIVLLRQLEMQTDATYAIKVVTRYFLAGVGSLLACTVLGLGWGDVQWLVAALGVGLGFGLQEIVANFVSGLIVLAERPIRIGDVVTVGSTTGKVARIQARATVLVDFDNKEVIIPNKTFITGSVVNWTLSSEVSRLVIKFGVAFGSDMVGVQQRIVEEVRLLPDVLPNPIWRPSACCASWAPKPPLDDRNSQGVANSTSSRPGRLREREGFAGLHRHSRAAGEGLRHRRVVSGTEGPDRAGLSERPAHQLCLAGRGGGPAARRSGHDHRRVARIPAAVEGRRRESRQPAGRSRCRDCRTLKGDGAAAWLRWPGRYQRIGWPAKADQSRRALLSICMIIHDQSVG
ncbi:MAG: mechanosensitive ion channel [Comamonadaceae bacterium]|nr:mechanosensitive ion channel [Comamonadaceae bacterium]